jgi:hypothetical protein
MLLSSFSRFANSAIRADELCQNCRRSEKTIVRIPHLTAAIQWLAQELPTRETLLENEVKTIYLGTLPEGALTN